jgi:GntR family transcriptional regulator, transcriptional repressor for pyruvate dehydrogenase complex
MDAPLTNGAEGHFGPPRQRVPKASGFVADELRAHIVGNHLDPGTRLPSEAQLIEQFGLSRATIREALRLLEAEGLIVVKRGPRGGLTVSRPNLYHISRSMGTMVALAELPLNQLFELRVVIEPPAAAAAAENATPEQRERLIAAASSRHGNVEEQVDFHLLVAEMSGNGLFQMILSALHDVLTWHVEGEPLTESDVADTEAAHLRIARAIASGSAAKAESTMRLHLETFQQRMGEAGRLEAPIIPRSAWRRGRTLGI